MLKTILHINPDKTLSHIAPEIYGQFSEHLGRCIYDGIYVGEDSDIPNVKGMRKDVVEALRALHLPVLRWPGGCFADEYHWRYRSQGEPPPYGKYQLGRHRRRQQLWHT